MNQGETIALMAAALMPPQPKPLSSVAANSCQGAVATAQPQTPMASASARGLGDAGHAETPMRAGQVGDCHQRRPENAR